MTARLTLPPVVYTCLLAGLMACTLLFVGLTYALVALWVRYLSRSLKTIEAQWPPLVAEPLPRNRRVSVDRDLIKEPAGERLMARVYASLGGDLLQGLRHKQAPGYGEGPWV